MDPAREISLKDQLVGVRLSAVELISLFPFSEESLRGKEKRSFADDDGADGTLEADGPVDDMAGRKSLDTIERA